MGCHTWFYKKIEVDYDVVKSNVIKQLERELDLLDRMINRRDEIGPEALHYVMLLDAIPEWTTEFGNERKAIKERQLSIIKKDLCKEAMYSKYIHGNPGSGIITRYIKGKGIFISTDDLPHGLFRRGNYPDDTLFSLEETLKYLDDNDSVISYPFWNNESENRQTRKEKCVEELTKFWKEYPDGMICFG